MHSGESSDFLHQHALALAHAREQAQVHRQRQRDESLSQCMEQEGPYCKSARRAERARESRRRKRDYVADLEIRVKELGEKIQVLQAREARERAKNRAEGRKSRLRLGEEEEIARRISKKQKVVLAEIRSLLGRNRRSEGEESSGADGALGKNLDQGQRNKKLGSLVEQFVANAKEKQAQGEVHLKKLSDALGKFLFISAFVFNSQLILFLVPVTHVKFIIWLLSRDLEFQKSPDDLWSTLVSELNLSESQMEKLLRLRQDMRKQCQAVSEIQEEVCTVGKNLKEMTSQINDTSEEIMRHLTPEQVSKYCLWVEENTWCMQMLNSLWNISSSA